MRCEHRDTSHIPAGRSSVAPVLGIVLFCGIFGGMASSAFGQSFLASRTVPTWQLIVDGEKAPWDVPAWPLDSLRAVTRRALAYVQQDGYYQASVDSIATDSSAASPRVQIFVRRGPQIPVGAIRLKSAAAIPEDTLRARMQTQPGAPLDPAQLEADIDALLDAYEDEGYPLARIRVAETMLCPGDPPTLRLTIDIDEGAALWFKRVQVPADVRTAPSFVAHVARLSREASLATYDPEAIRQRLRDTGLFREVGRLTLQVDDEGGAVVHVPLEERAPGTFDIAVGYLPPGTQHAAGRLVGSGHLQLENLFGGGRTAALELDRRPGRVSTADVRAADPYLFGMPIRLEGRFTGEQRDSTYGKQTYRGTLGVLFDASTEVFGTIARERTQPGVAGAALQGGVQRIPHASSWFTGLGLRVRRVDRAINPRRGLWVETTLERGQKIRRFRRIANGEDTTRVRGEARQERLRVHGRLFVPTVANQLVAIGADAAVLRSDTYDRSDLIRFGGANTLRGYDEDRFLGHVVARLLMEYRYQIDRASFAYVFGDLGVVAAPELDERPATHGWHPGYGLGIQVRTDLGRVRASYALNPDDIRPIQGRIHLGLSVDL